MEIILVEEMPNLGEVGDVVSVRPGYARNYHISKNFLGDPREYYEEEARS